MRPLLSRRVPVTTTVLALGAATLGVVLWGCSGRYAPALPSPGGGPATRTLSGVVNTDVFVVGPEERVACAGDVTVNCRTAQIRGALFSRPVTSAGRAGSSIAIQARQDVLMSGSITAANGADGSATGNGGSGGKGGDVVLRSAEGNLTVGTETAAASAQAAQVIPVFLQSGNGGSGGNGKLGGAGGDGGNLVLEATNGTLTIHECPGLFRIGNGGHGGNGVVEGVAMDSFTPPDQLPNVGGHSGQLGGTFAAVAGVEMRDTDRAQDGKPIKLLVMRGASLQGARGGNAGSFRFGAVTETASLVPARPAAVRVRPAGTKRIRGADGGDGATYGGEGGSVSYTARSGGPGAAGSSVEAEGGKGGEAHTLHMGFFHYLSNLVTSLFDDRDVYGGKGGDATAVGGNGGNGGPGESGGNGGSAKAIGGAGGPANDWCLDPSKWHSGQGGAATATGGDGGRGGDDCTPPPGAGGSGGSGGRATAYGGYGGSGDPFPQKLGPGGQARATGGAGGAGANGCPPGKGAAGGDAYASGGLGNPAGAKTEKQGGNGASGVSCCGPPPTIKTYGLVTSQSSNEFLSVFNKAFTVTLSPRQAAIALGGLSNPVYAFTGQSLVLAANGRDLWVGGAGQSLRLYRNFLTGGDRPPDLILTRTGGSASFCPASLWLDGARDILYCTYKPALMEPYAREVLAWHNVSSIAANHAPDRTITITDGGEVMGLTGDSVADRLFVTRFGATGMREVAVLDNASVRHGSAPPDRRLQGAVRGDSGLAYDRARDLLYGQVWDFGGNHAVAITGNASTADGAVTPRLLQGAATGLTGSPVALQVFPDTNLLFVCCAEGDVLYFRNAATLSGNVAPSGRQPFGDEGLTAMLAWQSG